MSSCSASPPVAPANCVDTGSLKDPTHRQPPHIPQQKQQQQSSLRPLLLLRRLLRPLQTSAAPCSCSACCCPCCCCHSDVPAAAPRAGWWGLSGLLPSLAWRLQALEGLNCGSCTTLAAASRSLRMTAAAGQQQPSALLHDPILLLQGSIRSMIFRAPVVLVAGLQWQRVLPCNSHRSPADPLHWQVQRC
jgi:hypothetical protein